MEFDDRRRLHKQLRSLYDNASVRDDVCPSPRFPPHLPCTLLSRERRGTVLCIIFTHVSVTPAKKCPLKSHGVVSACERTKDEGMGDRRNRGEGMARGPKAKQLMIAGRHECTLEPPTETSPSAPSTRAVFVGCLTTVNGP